MSSLAIVHSRALLGMEAPEVRVEVQLANGLPSFTLVGLAETEVKESRERVRAALAQSGFAFPHNKRVIVNLAPADLPKESGRFDLPIAIGILAAAGAVDSARLAAFEFAGELSLAGALRGVRGALALALGARRAGSDRHLVLPRADAQHAARVPGLRVLAADTLAEVAAALVAGAEAVPLVAPPRAGNGMVNGIANEIANGTSNEAASPSGNAVPLSAAAGPNGHIDLADVKGQAAAKRALEVAAAGAHSLLLVGPPGTGKSMLAQRLPGLLPPMADDEALDSAALLGLAGLGSAESFGQRAWRTPHHTASAVALVGGGSPPRPGEISLAHGGVLFLDELPEFPRAALEALREPLETGCISIARALRRARFPARFQLVAAMNPCPCGWLGAPAAAGHACRCAPEAVARYQGRLSGPLLDRIDLQVEVLAAGPEEMLAAPGGETSAQVAERVAQARRRQLERQGCSNAQLEAAGLQRHAALDERTAAFLEGAARRLAWSGRRLHRVLKVARSVADLAGSAAVQTVHLAEALQYQRALSAR
jgi:magnesium chelatase family protein